MDTRNNNQRTIVRSILNANMSENWDFGITSKPTRTKIQPLPLQLHGPTIKANHIKKLYNNGHKNLAIINCKKIVPHMTHETGVLNPKTEKAHTAIYKTIKKNALQGDIDDQIFIRNHLVNKCTPLLSYPEFILKTQEQETSYACEFLTFEKNLSEKNKFSITPENVKKQINELKYIACDPVSCILHACRHLQAITDFEKNITLQLFMDKICPQNPEIKEICQFIINYGDNTLPAESAKKFIQRINAQKNISVDLYTIAQSPLCPLVIQQLKKTHVDTDESLLVDLNLFLAELYYYSKNDKAAHSFYSKNKASYFKEKNDSLNNFTTKALISCIKSTDVFCKQDIEYLYSLMPNIHNTLEKATKNNTRLSYGIGLLTQAMIKHSMLTEDLEQKIITIVNGLEHLEYAQKDGFFNNKILSTITDVIIEFHTTLSTLFALKNDNTAALQHIQSALEYSEHTNNSSQNNELLTILRQNSELYQHHAQWITKVLHLILNPCEQKHTNQYKDSSFTEFAASNVAQQLLPHLEQAYTTHKNNKNEIAHILALVYQNNGDYNKACYYLHLLPGHDQPFMHYFIQNITSQKNTSQILRTIAHSPACSTIIDTLRSITIDNKNPLLPVFNQYIAELSYYSKNYKQAHEYYSKIPKNKLSPTTKTNAFNACIAAADTFSKKEINYLSALFNNIGNQLKAIEITDPKLSYKIALITQYLMHNNTQLSTKEKTDVILNGLDHLEYAQKSEALKNAVAPLLIEFHTSLSNIYETNNNYVASLQHARRAIKYHPDSNQNLVNSAIETILTQAEKQNPELYNLHACLINIVVKFINHESYNDKQNNYTLLPEFASSDLFSQLLPYCEQAHTTNTQKSNEIICLIALAHKNKGNYNKACDYIDNLSQPTPRATLCIKAEIYTAAQKTLPDTDLEAAFTLFTNNKKPSTKEQELITLLIATSNDFFIRTHNYDLALKLITKFAELHHAPAIAIKLAFYVRKHLIETNNSYFKQWQKKLHASQLYNVQDPSAYDGDTNASISLLIMEKSPTDYEKIIAHFTAALESNDLLPETVKKVEDTCSQLYCEWAEKVKHDKEKLSCLLDRAIIKHNSSLARYQKAVYILNTTDNIKMANHALELLEKNISNNSPEKAASQLALAVTYFNHHPDSARIPIIQQLIPLDIPKAMSYLTEHNHDKSLLTILRNILAGNSLITMTPETQKELIDLDEALKITEFLITMHGSTIDELAQRAFLYGQLNLPKKAIEDIDRMLNTQDLSNTTGITQEKLLTQKIKFLLYDSPDDNSYDQVLECFKQLDNKGNLDLELATSSKIQERTHLLIAHKKYDHNAIDWCSFIAKVHLAANPITPPNSATQEQKELADYLLTAAKIGNINAQFILLPYLSNAINSDDICSLVEALSYTHAVLLNPSAADKKDETRLLVNLLRTFTEKGIVLPYYILCDYYKKNRQQFEETMLLFSQAKNQHHYRDNKTNTIEKTCSATIEKICTSCKDMLMMYVNRYLKNEKKALKIDTLAVFTLGSMYQYSDSPSLLTAASFYLKEVAAQLVTTFKLPHFAPTVQNLLVNVYQQQAVLTDSPITQLNFYRRSAALGYLPAIHKIAEMFIQQHKEGKNDLEISVDECILPLKQDIESHNPSNSHSHKLFEECAAIIQDKNKKNIPNKQQSVIKNTTNSPVAQVNVVKTDTMSIEKRMEIITNYASANKMVKNINDKEKSQLYGAALLLHQQGKLKDAAAMYQKTIDKENHPSACIMLALSYITADLTCRNYTLSEKLLNQALSYGLIIKSRHDKAKQFATVSVLSTILCYMESLITQPHPQPIKSCLLSIIKEKFLLNGIILTHIDELFKKISGIDLNTVPEWKTSEEINNTLSKNEVVSLRNEIDKACAIVDFAQNNNDSSQGMALYCLDDIYAPSDTAITKENKLKQPSTSDLKKSMIKYPKYIESDPAFCDGSKAYSKGNMQKGSKLMNESARHHNPGALITLAIDTLVDAKTNAYYSSVKGFLIEALFYGLEKDQFSYPYFLSTLCSFIELLFNKEHSPLIKQEFSSIIRKKLETSNVNLAAFYEIVLEETKIKLPSMPEWQTDEEKKQHKQTPSAHKKKTFKYQEYKETSQLFIKGMLAYNNARLYHKKEQLNYALQLIKMAISQDQHPIACLLLAKHYLNNISQFESNKKQIVEINYPVLEDLLNQSVDYSCKKNQFKTDTYLDALCAYIENFLNKKHSPLMKQRFFFILKNGLKENNISDEDFCAIVLEKTTINLALDRDWNTSKDTKPIPIIFSSGNIFEDMQLLEALTGKNNNSSTTTTTTTGFAPKKPLTKDEEMIAIELFTNKEKPAEKATSILKRSLIKDADYKEECRSFIFGLQAYQQGQQKIGLGLIKSAAEKNNHPGAYMDLAITYLTPKGVEQDYTASEQYLYKGLLYGLEAGKFCNKPFLKYTCIYLTELVTATHPSATKQKILLMLKGMLELNEVNIADFCTLFYAKTTIDLSTIPEWSYC